ncbi:hypothetical protein DPMN_170059 [Dreissena polymorpha]|uniref:Uncharacterized protein n=1 Tax=Dreissena polymorpha TaxID=45954 RepID=A0A9D4IE87_DREPO|nr:hypothetical protein DPMN_170059 [Dreissena polymorpha]
MKSYKFEARSFEETGKQINIFMHAARTLYGRSTAADSVTSPMIAAENVLNVVGTQHQSLKRELERMQDWIEDRYPDYGTFHITALRIKDGTTKVATGERRNRLQKRSIKIGKTAVATSGRNVEAIRLNQMKAKQGCIRLNWVEQTVEVNICRTIRVNTQ